MTQISRDRIYDASENKNMTVLRSLQPEFEPVVHKLQRLRSSELKSKRNAHWYKGDEASHACTDDENWVFHSSLILRRPMIWSFRQIFEHRFGRNPA